jgi:hypothetical protein
LALIATGSRSEGMDLAASPPTWISRQTTELWHQIVKGRLETLSARIEARRAELKAAARELPRGSVDLPDEPDAEATLTSTYGKPPEVWADQGHGAVYPLPLPVPTEISWFSLAIESLTALRELERFERGLERWSKLPVPDRVRRFAELTGAWDRLGSRHAVMARKSRYLDTWVPQLERQWKEAQAEGKIPSQYELLRALAEARTAGGAEAQLSRVREAFRPRRVAHRSFLPTEAHGRITLPIATDVTDRRYLAEIEGALDTHWNQSSWARSQGASFVIRWTFIPFDREFAAGKSSMENHLKRFPENEAGLTTGGLTTFTRGQVLVLGPGKIQPRTLAHEIGHLLGFNDCYFRTLSRRDSSGLTASWLRPVGDGLASWGLFGNAVLEWDNPLYPDDLMCDNISGAARAEAW